MSWELGNLFEGTQEASLDSGEEVKEVPKESLLKPGRARYCWLWPETWSAGFCRDWNGSVRRSW